MSWPIERLQRAHRRTRRRASRESPGAARRSSTIRLPLPRVTATNGRPSQRCRGRRRIASPAAGCDRHHARDADRRCLPAARGRRHDVAAEHDDPITRHDGEPSPSRRAMGGASRAASVRALRGDDVGAPTQAHRRRRRREARSQPAADARASPRMRIRPGPAIARAPHGPGRRTRRGARTAAGPDVEREQPVGVGA